MSCQESSSSVYRTQELLASTDNSFLPMDSYDTTMFLAHPRSEKALQGQCPPVPAWRQQVSQHQVTQSHRFPYHPLHRGLKPSGSIQKRKFSLICRSPKVEPDRLCRNKLEKLDTERCTGPFLFTHLENGTAITHTWSCLFF